MTSVSDDDQLILFHFEAFDVVRYQRIRGSWWAKNQQQAEFWLKNQGYTDILLQASPTRQHEVRVQDGALALFYRQLAVMFRAGLQLTSSLELASHSEDRHLGGVCLRLADLLRAGFSLSDAMRSFPAVFDPVTCGLVAAAESSGRLPRVLARLADSQDRRYKLRKTVIAAVTYPAIMGVCTLGLSALFFFYLSPLNQALFASLNMELPALNRWLGRALDIVKSPMVAVLVLALGGWATVLFRTPRFRHRLHGQFMRFVVLIPFLDDLVSKGRALRMLDILALLLDGGGSLTQALRFMKEACVNDQEHEALKKVQRLIVEGANFGSALREAEFFPPLIISLLEVGDETGQLERMAQRSAEICEEDVRHAVDSAMTLLEPILLAIAGFIAGLAIITSVMPMLSLLQGL